MKILVETLGDQKKYKFSTFSVTEAIGLKRLYRKFEDKEQDANKIRYEIDTEGNFKKENGHWIPKENLTSKEKDALDKIEDDQLEFMADVVRKSICKHHKEFAKDTDNAKDKAIRDNLMNIIDLEDMKNLTHFKGIYLKEKSVIEFDLNEESDDTTK